MTSLPQRRLTTRRKLAFAAAATLLLALVCEGAARWADVQFGFRATVLNAIAAAELLEQPVAARTELPLPAPRLTIRREGDPPGPSRPYAVGGRVIPDATGDVATVDVTPDALPPGGNRVFVVGGSAAFGFPYPQPKSFASVLDGLASGRGWRVFNAAAPGRCSGEVAPVVDRILTSYGPRVLVIYSGNNEWIHWQPPEPGGGRMLDPALMRRLAASRAAAAVAYGLLRLTAPGRDAPPATGDAFAPQHDLTGSAYALRHPLDATPGDVRATWPETKRRFLATFEANLRRMAGAGRERGVRVVLLTVPFNYRLSPAWKHRQPEWFDPEHREAVVAAIRRAAERMRTGRHEEALAELGAASAKDPMPAILHYLEAECLERLGRADEAEQAYARSRECMIGNLGSILGINEVIARVARDEGAELLDVRKLFDDWEHARGRHFNQDLIHDGCHPTPQGHRLIAEALDALLR